MSGRPVWIRRALGLLVAGSVLCGMVAESAQFRFPRPDFKSGYQQPQEQAPAARSDWLEWLDVGVLIAMILMSSYFALRGRSRRWLLGLSLLALLYFGFYRRGCVCPVGSTQNVVLALFDRTYAIPLVVVAFFGIPLFMTLLFGRTFCAAVCPLGTVQDAVLAKPVRVPMWLESVLGLLPHVYLSLAVLMAATGAGFVICRLDPFVGLFRLGAHRDLVVLGVFFLVLGLFVGRPYCRYACPYGVLLGWFSRVAWRHLTITPDECVNCRLCQDACPFGAIRVPTPERYPEPRSVGVRRLFVVLMGIPFLVFAGWLAGSRLEVPLSIAHKDVKLAELLQVEEASGRKGLTPETETFRSQGRPTGELAESVRRIRRQFAIGGGLVGAYLGLVIGVKLCRLSVRRRRVYHEIEPGLCVSCGRCFLSCPKERDRLVRLGAG